MNPSGREKKGKKKEASTLAELAKKRGFKNSKKPYGGQSEKF